MTFTFASGKSQWRAMNFQFLDPLIHRAPKTHLEPFHQQGQELFLSQKPMELMFGISLIRVINLLSLLPIFLLQSLQSFFKEWSIRTTHNTLLSGNRIQVLFYFTEFLQILKILRDKVAMKLNLLKSSGKEKLKNAFTNKNERLQGEMNLKRIKNEKRLRINKEQTTFQWKT